jgi:hypothetical protein
MKKLSALFFVLVLGTSMFAQGWTFDRYIPSNEAPLMGNTGSHGVAVDPYGKVWSVIYGNTDSIFNGTVMKPCRAVYCYNPDGTPAPFSPIKTITVNGVTDTMWNSSRGLKSDAQGNILYSAFDAVYKIDYKTGAGLGKVIPTFNQTLTAVAVDGNNNVFTAHVIPSATNALKIFDASFAALGNALDSTVGFSRDFEVGADGNSIYWAGYTNHVILKYTRPDEFSPFSLTDSVFKGFDSESFCWNRKYNKLWASAGSKADSPNRYPGATTYWRINAWYAMDPATNEITDSLFWNFFNADSANTKPRGIAFTPSGDTAYVACFGASTIPAVERFINPNPSSVKDLGLVADDFRLFQNYPNPFNPSTEIKFALKTSGFTTLKVYDILGKEVATLVSENLNSGVYAFTFDASKLASGTYIYEVVSNNVRLTNKMLLMK